MTRAALGVAMSVGSMLVGPVALADLAASRVLVTKGDYAAAEQGLRAIRGAERAAALIALARAPRSASMMAARNLHHVLDAAAMARPYNVH